MSYTAKWMGCVFACKCNCVPVNYVCNVLHRKEKTINDLCAIMMRQSESGKFYWNTNSLLKFGDEIVTTMAGGTNDIIRDFGFNYSFIEVIDAFYSLKNQLAQLSDSKADGDKCWGSHHWCHRCSILCNPVFVCGHVVECQFCSLSCTRRRQNATQLFATNQAGAHREILQKKYSGEKMSNESNCFESFRHLLFYLAFFRCSCATK